MSPLKTLEKFADCVSESVCHIAKMITHYTVLNETRKCLMVMRSVTSFMPVKTMIRPCERETFISRSDRRERLYLAYHWFW